MKAERFDDGGAHDASWDDWVRASWNGTFIQTRRFLSYHGDRFRDFSIRLVDDRSRLLGVLPAAVDPHDESWVTSHPGITYGGLIHAGGLPAPEARTAYRQILVLLRDHGYAGLRCKPVPWIYHVQPTQDETFALVGLGARQRLGELTAAVSLTERPRIHRLRRRGIAKARGRGVAICSGREFFEPFWKVLEEKLESRFGASPVHSLEEILELERRFPDEIMCTVARSGDEVLAGVVTFWTRRVAHVQYMANAPGDPAGALDLALLHLMERAVERGLPYFDFGTSNATDSGDVNEGLYAYKASFGAGGVSHECYEIGT